MSKKIRVAVLYGGQSAEHEVSVNSARTILDHLNPRRYQPLAIQMDRKGNSLLSSLSKMYTADVVFPILHGPMGEDGTVQGFLELAHLPYVGCGVLASAVGMDKEVAKRLAMQARIPVLPHVLLRSWKELKSYGREVKRLGLPLFVKPVRLGSSVGIFKVKKWPELGPAVRRAFRYDTKVMLEKGVEGQEICCGVLGEPGDVRVSVCGEIKIGSQYEFFDYKAKYLDQKGHELLIPAPLSFLEAGRIRDFAKRAFEIFEGHGMARVDFFVGRRTRKIYFGEINTIPGFTSQSLYPSLWQASGFSL
ncbi:MAG: D-alanine--D-alanine ligase, partial [Elusimicrobia bacterium]|nr:D-alanine--D-alanine ligase [Elusimicrobiota bacterium]